MEIPDQPANTRQESYAVEAENLTKKFLDEYAVREVTMAIPRGNIFGLIGPSGSGKTTTVRLLTGIYEPTSGKARLLGHDPRKFTPHERELIGYMPQLFVLYPDLSVWENINFAASIYGLNLFRRRKILMELLDFVELSEHRKKLVRDISGGMQRRLSLAATLVHNPEMIFLDEPTAGIDPVLRAKFWDHFKELRTQGRTLFVTTQYVGEAAYCHYVGVMVDGRLILVDTPEGLRRRAFGGDVVDLKTNQPIGFNQMTEIQALPFVIGRIRFLGENGLRITVQDASTAIPELINWTNGHNMTVDSVSEFVPPFDDVFVLLVQKESQNV